MSHEIHGNLEIPKRYQISRLDENESLCVPSFLRLHDLLTNGGGELRTTDQVSAGQKMMSFMQVLKGHTLHDLRMTVVSSTTRFFNGVCRCLLGSSIWEMPASIYYAIY